MPYVEIVERDEAGVVTASYVESRDPTTDSRARLDRIVGLPSPIGT